MDILFFSYLASKIAEYFSFCFFLKLLFDYEKKLYNYITNMKLFYKILNGVTLFFVKSITWSQRVLNTLVLPYCIT